MSLSMGLSETLQYTERAEDVSELCCVDETLTLSVVRLERLHEVGKRTSVCFATDGLVDRQNFLEFVLFLACKAPLKVSEIGAIQKLRYGFLFAFYSNYGDILYRLRDIETYW